MWPSLVAGDSLLTSSLPYCFPHNTFLVNADVNVFEDPLA